MYQLIADTVSSPNNNKDIILKNRVKIVNDEIKDDENGKIIFSSKDYIFMENMGRGAYGVVDKSFQLKSCQIVAIKRSRSAKQEIIHLFKKEILICSPNIVKHNEEYF